MDGILDGKEVEGKISDFGDYFVDADVNGKVTIAVRAEKQIEDHTKISSTNLIETDIFKILEKITQKTETTLDDKAVQGIKTILGML